MRIMKCRFLMLGATLMLIAVTAMPLRTLGQEQEHEKGHSRYKLIELGTFGGPVSTFFLFTTQKLNEQGIAGGIANTSAPNPYFVNDNPLFLNNVPFPSPDPFVEHAFRWNDGTLTDLDTLPGGASSFTEWINALGEIVGFSDNGLPDPVVGVPQIRAVIWKKDGKIVDLGTLKGGFESLGVANNDRGEVIGVSTNDVPDSISFFGMESRAVLWTDGVIRDLGTLGDDPDSFSVSINNRGQVAGFSFSASRTHPFLWENGAMLDLGTLGGNFAQAVGLNNRGQVTGTSTLLGDADTHPFFWDRGSLTDLGTFGGTFGEPTFINDDGNVVGDATFPDGTQHAALWKDGKIRDLGTIDSGCASIAWAVNSSNQVVGASFPCSAPRQAFLWENGSMIDLNTLVPPPSSGLHLAVGQAINDHGEIAGFGFLPNGDARAFLLIPCDENHGDLEHCDNDTGRARDSAAQIRPTQTTSK